MILSVFILNKERQVLRERKINTYFNKFKIIFFLITKGITSAD